jgi:hypothetical protein
MIGGQRCHQGNLDAILQVQFGRRSLIMFCCDYTGTPSLEQLLASHSTKHATDASFY